MIRTFRYPLRPTKAQEAVLEGWRLKCCELYNAALEERREAWRRQRIGINYVVQSRELTELRAADDEWRGVPVEVSRSALRRLQKAFDNFFRRVKAGVAPGFPRFRSRDRYDSFDLGSQSDEIRIEGNALNVPKLGMVRFHKYRELRGTVKLVRIGRSARGWYVAFGCDVGEAPPKIAVRSAIGIDVGLEAFATLSNGERVENPRFERSDHHILAMRQRSLDTKRRGSKSRWRAKALLGRAHEHIRNRRTDFARKLACVLFARFDLIAHEDLAISRMVHGNLARSIHDAAWGLFLDALQCKAESAGKWCVPVDPRGTSQACAACGAVEKKELSERTHVCPCGFSTHRDHNAALNVLARGYRAGQLTEARRPS